MIVREYEKDEIIKGRYKIMNTFEEIFADINETLKEVGLLERSLFN